jgi:hypothetical protein
MILKKLSQLTFLTVSLISANSLPAQSVILQMGIQETFIEGEYNQVNQIFNQNITLGIIYLPDREGSLIPNFNLQDSFVNKNNNEIKQIIKQNFSFFTQVRNNFNLDNFNLDLSLNSIQSSIQVTFIEGNNNFVQQKSQQNIVDLFLFHNWENNNLLNLESEDILEIILFDEALDSLQSIGQDIIIFGNQNLVSQEINQNLINLLFLDDSLYLNQIILEKLDNLFDNNPAQLVIQETFIINQGENNQVNQIINQTISDLFFLTPTLPILNNDYSLDQNQQNLANFDIEGFLSNILEESIINAHQINEQNVFIIGNENKSKQVNNQAIIATVPENNSSSIILLIGIIGLSQIAKEKSG